MRKVDVLLDEYGKSRQSKVNKKIHWICVPAIMFSLLEIFLISLLMILILKWVDAFSMPLWQIACAVIIVAWIGQFVRHHIEGKRPSFFKDIQFLLIGPAWLLANVYRQFHLRY